MTPAYRYKATVVRVIDGDTYEMDIDLGLRVHARAIVRLRGWNCPERSTREGKRARVEASLIVSDKPLIVETYKDVQSFARWVADVYIAETGVHVGELLAQAGCAAPLIV